jgi:pyruvate dehydrogenase E2 component (dihydrolipoamide acetyltransferase)
MIKYVELTAPQASAFRQVKILSIECQEGSEIKEGDTLFRVQSGAHEINLPATKAGRVVELIAAVNEKITLSTALLLLETEVKGSTASKPINHDDDLQKVLNDIEGSEMRKTEDEGIKRIKPAAVKSSPSKETKISNKKPQSVAKKKHQQQSLDLKASASSEPDKADSNELGLTQLATSAATRVNDHSQPSLTMPSSSIIKVTVPDIGADSAKVIEILVNVGDNVSIEDPLVTLESDKASMDVPSTHNGVVTAISVLVDQDINEGTLLLELESEESSPIEENATDKPAKAADEEQSPSQESPAQQADLETETGSGSATHVVDVRIPDIGGDSAKVIELLVDVGDQVEIEDPLVTLESDKASMDVPSSAAGIIKSIEVKIDQEVNEGILVVTIIADQTAQQSSEVPAVASSAGPEDKTSTDEAAIAKPEEKTKPPVSTSKHIAANKQHAVDSAKSHASPSIRRFARELGVDLANISGSARKGRITHDDVKGFVKGALNRPTPAAPSTPSGSGIPAVPAQDFSKFGEIDIQPLNKIKRLTAQNLHRSWLNVPHVTHNDESNISDLESFRKQLNSEYQQQKRDIKLSPLAFIVKAVVNALQHYPQFNSSLEPGGENLIYKKYFNIGIAVETPNGLVVPVLKDADKKSVAEIAKEMGDLAKKARDKKLTMKDMSGACITISSLGGIGGTGFTPIVNAPEVAILGVSRSKMQPVWNGAEFEPGMMLPLNLSYDHRVIDGAEAARFTRHIAAVLEDVRRLTV